MKSDFPKVTQPVRSKLRLEAGVLLQRSLLFHLWLSVSCVRACAQCAHVCLLKPQGALTEVIFSLWIYHKAYLNRLLA